MYIDFVVCGELEHFATRGDKFVALVHDEFFKGAAFDAGVAGFLFAIDNCVDTFGIDKVAEEHAFVYKEAVGCVVKGIGAVFANDEYTIVLGHVHEHVAVDIVTEVTCVFVIAQLEVALGGFTHIYLIKGSDFGAAWILIFVLIDQIFDEVDGIADDVVEIGDYVKNWKLKPTI